MPAAATLLVVDRIMTVEDGHGIAVIGLEQSDASIEQRRPVIGLNQQAMTRHARALENAAGAEIG